MAIEKVFTVSSDMQNRTRNMGNNIPPWFPNYQNVDNWYWTTEEIEPRIAFYYNYVGDDVYIQYGKDDIGWASARFFGQTFEILNEEEQENGDILVTVRVQANFFNGRKNNNPVTGHPVKYVIKINNVVQWNWTGDTTDSFSNSARPPQEFDVLVKPEETSTLTALTIEIEYPTGIYDDRELIVGVGLRNPNPPTYVPMAIRKTGNWKDLVRNNGKILRRVNNKWIDYSQEKISTIRQVNQGKNRIRKSSNWRQLPYMRNGGI